MARINARDPRTPTPARGRCATTGRPRRRLHPALPLQVAAAAALDRAASLVVVRTAGDPALR